MRCPRRLAALTAAALSTAAAPAQFSATQVALTGQSAPGAGVATYESFFNPVLNGAGQVGFVATLTGGTSTQGVFVGAPGSVAAAALQGQSAPGAGSATYDGFFFDTVLNGAGQVAFKSLLTGGTSTQGVFVGAPGSVAAAALQGQSAPGAGAATYSLLNVPVLNGAGQVGFTAVLAGTGVTAANDRALFAGSVGNIQLVVREGDVIATTAGSKTVDGISFVAGSGGEDGKAMSYGDGGFLVALLSFTDTSQGVFVFTPVPEPGTVLGAAAVGLGLARLVRRRRGKSQSQP